MCGVCVYMVFIGNSVRKMCVLYIYVCVGAYVHIWQRNDDNIVWCMIVWLCSFTSYILIIFNFYFCFVFFFNFVTNSADERFLSQKKWNENCWGIVARMVHNCILCGKMDFFTFILPETLLGISFEFCFFLLKSGCVLELIYNEKSNNYEHFCI